MCAQADEGAHLLNSVLPVARSVCERYFGDRPFVLEDVYSTVCIRLCLKQDTLANADNPHAYAATIAHNVCRQHLRDERRSPQTVSLDYVGATAGRMTLEEAVERRMMLQAVADGIWRLDTRRREVFLARVLEGRSYEEIAAEKGLESSTVRKMVSECRRELRKRLAQAHDGSQSAEEQPHTPRAEPSRASEAGGGRPKRRRRSLQWYLNEIAWRYNDTRVIHVPLPTGGVLEYHAVFEDNLSRRRQRVETLRAYVERHPQGWLRHLELSRLLIAENNHAEAEAVLRSILRGRPATMDASLLLGRLLSLSGRLSEAVEVYGAALRYLRNAPERRHVAGLMERAKAGALFPRNSMAFGGEHFQKAVQEFHAAIEADPKNLAHYHELGLTCEAWGKPREALEAYTAALAVDPDDIFALARSHNSATALGRFDIAVERLERAVALDPNYTYAVKLLADRRAIMGLVRGSEGRRTLNMLHRVLARDPNSADAIDALCTFYRCRGEFDKSIAVVREFLSRNPTNAKGWTFLSTAYCYVGEMQQAADAIVHAWELDPSWLDIYIRGLDVLAIIGRRKMVLRWLREVDTRFPDDWGANLVVAGTLRTLGREPDEWLPRARRAVEMQPNLAQAWLAYAVLLQFAGRHKEALDACEHAEQVAYGPATLDSVGSAYHAGLALRFLGQEAEAKKRFLICEQLVEALRKYHPTVLEYLARSRLELGDLSGAHSCYRELLRFAPWYPRLAWPQYVELRQRIECTSIQSARTASSQRSAK